MRRLGLTYGEIHEIIPVPKGTLSNWCRDVDLTPAQIAAIKRRMPSQRDVPKDSQWRRRREVEQIRAEAVEFAAAHIRDSRFVAGIVMYWAEGSKWRNDFAVANTDPSALRLFVAWVREYLDPAADFRLSLHLHEGNCEANAKEYWRRILDLPSASFTKTFVKPKGTGHRKNRLAQGVCRVRVLRSSDHWNRTMAWIDYVSAQLG